MQWVIGALEGTPWWVWALLAYMIFVGIKSSKTNVVPLTKLFILPVVIIAIEFEALVRLVNDEVGRALLWLISMAAGIAIGWLSVRRLSIRADKSRGLIELPGTWTTMVALMLIFAVKYFFGFMDAASPGVMAEPGWVVAQLVITGVLAGWLVGRSGCMYWKYRSEPHNELAEASAQG
ncbi:hypothetical protein [Amorphus orientalis]|uniref:DUF1453 domain-containing protein n=1 Tax=Amorphus orientalis TaxID=649198 RepID=A0AAE3VS53_9HYPH|nr:hypothetical protein [Amorphus orientalis]MDQ0317195.1 hypothetical protein [Amorphus orientalis]